MMPFMNKRHHIFLVLLLLLIALVISLFILLQHKNEEPAWRTELLHSAEQRQENTSTHRSPVSTYITEPVPNKPYPGINYGGECGDIRLVYFDEEGRRFVVEESMGKLVQPLLDKTGGCRDSLRMVSIHPDLSAVIFAQNSYEGSSGGVWYTYQIEAAALRQLLVSKINGVNVLSPDKLKVLTVPYELSHGVMAQKMYLLDLVEDTSHLVLDLKNESETLLNSSDGYGPIPTFHWVDENTVEYMVFDINKGDSVSEFHPLKNTHILSL